MSRWATAPAGSSPVRLGRPDRAHPNCNRCAEIGTQIANAAIILPSKRFTLLSLEGNEAPGKCLQSGHRSF